MKNGYFQLDVRFDGTYLMVFPPQDLGIPCDPLEITRYLDERNIDYSQTQVYEIVKNAAAKTAEARITTLNPGRIDESLFVTMSAENMSAIARFYPPAKDGKRLDEHDIVSFLEKKGIRNGIDNEAIQQFINNRQYCTSYIVAEADLPVEGSDAVITYNFNTDLSRKPKLNEDGSVDFHQLDNVSHIEKGDVIAALTPAVQGKPGTDVTGKPIKPKKVNVKFLRQVKHTKLSPDGLQLLSEVSGHVSLVDGQIFVSDTYVVPANVDASTGDIKYSGNVQIEGNVNTGYRVEAMGDIIVNGIVEGAELIAEGQIILKRGIQGMGRGILNAKGNVVSRFIESAEVIAGGFIQTESIMHSKVTAGQEILVRGRKGFITGGEIRSGKYIQAKTAGSIMGTATVLEVGVNLRLSEEMHQLEQELEELKNNIDKADKVINFISRKIKEREQLTPDKLEQFHQLSAQKREMENRLNLVGNKLNHVAEELDNSEGGYILIDDIIYPGCKVTISNVTTYIRNETKHSRLIRDGADVRVAAY